METLRNKYFPAFTRSPTKEWVLLDNAGGSQTNRFTIDCITEYLSSSNVQLGASYNVSVSSTQKVEEGKRAAAIFVNARRVEEVVMGSSTTQLLFNLSCALKDSLTPGDEIIVTNVDHEANLGCWVRLAKEKNLVLKFWTVDTQTFELPLQHLDALLTSRTALVCFTHCSNVLGSIMPVKDITTLVHSRSKHAKVIVDGVAYAPHRAIDVRAWDVDFYVFSWYKVYGPHVSVLYGKYEHLVGLTSLNHYFIGEEDVPYKIQPGNANYELTYSISGILKYFVELASEMDETVKRDERECVTYVFEELITRQEEKLSTILLQFLNSHSDKIKVIGCTEPSPNKRVPTISFIVRGRSSTDVVETARKHNIGIRWGHFYAKRLVEDAIGLDDSGVVRVSMVHYNTEEEVEKLIQILRSIVTSSSHL